MALSQIQCLDENHVNPRTHESKPEFFYCEDQRLAVETLLRDGREAFAKYLEARGLRGFLSDPELETLAGVVEPYDPGAELFQEDDEDDPTPLSQHYWPDLSDTSVPQMDLGWPDSGAYRGVTRATVYTQPPLDGQTHIKEVVRKLIAQAQKMIAVAMDVFTDVDIFRDLLDAGFKRRVSVYILLERATLPHFLSMCQRANMHAGHFKHLRVRCTGGNEFCTRSCYKVKGRMGHRFMFIDGDKAVSGSYSFTWMSSRLDRNLITVVTGQATDSFDRLFRFLFVTSSSVDLRQVAVDPEPELEPLPQPATVAPPSADIARKLYNPKYALVALSNPNPTTSVGCVSPKETQSSENSKKKRQRRAGEEATKDAPPLHPGLMNLEKAYLIPYLPTWPEPDPSSDVIGFINIRDANRPNQVHLQRSEMFGTSQAIRFSSPFGEAKKTSPEVTNPKQTTAKHEEANKPQPAQNKTEAEKLVVADKARLGVASSDIKSEQEAPEQKLTACENKSEPDKDATKAANAENKLYSKTATNQGARHGADVLSTVVDRPRSQESNGTQNSPGPADSNTEQDMPAETVPSHPPAVLLKPEIQTPVVHRHVSSTSASFTTLSPRLPSPPSSSSSSASPSLTSAPPIPKPRTVQLVIQDGSKLPELCEFKRPQAVVQTPPGKEPETDPEQQDKSGSKTEARKGKEATGNPEEAPQQTRSATPRKTEVNEADGRHDGRAGARVVAGTEPPTRSDVLITDVPKAAGANIRGIIPKDVDPKSSTSTDCNAGPTLTSTPNATAVINYSSGAADGKTSRGETPTLSGSAGDSSPARRCKEETTEAEGTAHEEQNGRKLPHTLPKSQRVQQLDSLALSPPRVPRPPRPLSATQISGDRPSGSRQPNQTALPGSPQVLDNNPHRPPPSPSLPGSAGSAPGRKQVSDSQQSLVPRQPPAAPSRTRDGPTQNQTASHKPQSPFLFTQRHPQPRSQVLSAQEAHEQEDGKSPFSFSFSKLYSLKALKDKMSKLPAQSKRGSSSPPVQGQGKSTS
ncbi:protein FAM83G [Embiotoca jacksoni]|uniref:protein FAM83G n=1 Tax=Embiotoca jacksoni TaxID=100190 RepID=UPI00370400A6